MNMRMTLSPVNPMPFIRPADSEAESSDAGFAKKTLEVRGALIFTSILLTMTLLAAVFQYLGGNAIRHIIPTTLAYGLCVVLGGIIYRRKKLGENTGGISWAVSLLITAFAVYARYNYALTADWLYAVEGIHIHAVAIVSLISLQFLYNRTIYLVNFLLFSVNWALFMYLAHLNGVEMHMLGIVDGVVQHGRVVILVQLYFYLMVLVIGYINYKNIPVIEDFDALTARQRETIIRKSRAERRTSGEIVTGINDLFFRLETLDRELSLFNSRLQNQASTFEEISASVEEITSTAENISSMASRQVEGNADMEYTLKEFFEIKNHTRERLNASLDNMSGVLKESETGAEILDSVEQSIGEIKGQSDVIAETVNIIIDIAEEINMLSLNASIEAARAGNQGRGFAVVAREIGRLAGATGESVKKIQQVLSRNAEVTDRGVVVIRRGSESVKRMIGDIVQSSGKINELRDNIFLEEKFLEGIDRQMKMNLQVAGETGTGTLEQRTALEAVTGALENLSTEVSAMVEGIVRISETSARIYGDAQALLAVAGELSGENQ